MLKYTIIFAVVAGLVFALAPAAQANDLTGPHGIMIPPGDDPATGQPWAIGGKYHLVFVTSTMRDATSTAIADYNTHVNTAADGSPMVGVADVEWYAIASTATKDAKDNAVVSAPIYKLNGTRMDVDYSTLWDGVSTQPLNSRINYTEKGGTPTYWRIFTGTTIYGVASANPLGDPSGWVTHGIAIHERPSWIESIAWYSGGPYPANPQHPLLDWTGQSRSLYALSEELTVIPEPATMGLLGLGAVALIVRRRSTKLATGKRR